MWWFYLLNKVNYIFSWSNWRSWLHLFLHLSFCSLSSYSTLIPASSQKTVSKRKIVQVTLFRVPVLSPGPQQTSARKYTFLIQLVYWQEFCSLIHIMMQGLRFKISVRGVMGSKFLYLCIAIGGRTIATNLSYYFWESVQHYLNMQSTKKYNYTQTYQYFLTPLLCRSLCRYFTHTSWKNTHGAATTSV